MNDKSKLNGSVDLLPDAMRKVFTESDKDRINTANENKQTQFAEQQKHIGNSKSSLDNLAEYS